MRVRAETPVGSFELVLDPASDQLVVNDTIVNLDEEVNIRRLVQENLNLRPIVTVTLGLKVTDPLRALLAGLAIGGVRVVEEALDNAHDESWPRRAGLLTKILQVSTSSDLLQVVLGVACWSRDLRVTDPKAHPVAS